MKFIYKKNLLWKHLVNVILVILVFLIFYTLFNEFPKNQYNTVANRWFATNSVVPPKDYNKKILRPVSINLIALRERDEKKSETFYWLTNSGDLIGITNQNFKKINGVLTFILESDPCNQSRKITVSTLGLPLNFTLDPNLRKVVNIPLKIKSNSTIFLALTQNDNLTCSLENGDERIFVAKLINPEFKIN